MGVGAVVGRERKEMLSVHAKIRNSRFFLALVITMLSLPTTKGHDINNVYIVMYDKVQLHCQAIMHLHVLWCKRTFANSVAPVIKQKSDCYKRKTLEPSAKSY